MTIDSDMDEQGFVVHKENGLIGYLDLQRRGYTVQT